MYQHPFKVPKSNEDLVWILAMVGIFVGLLAAWSITHP